MNRELYEFKEEDALSFAAKMGTQTKRSGDELQFRFCPYCKGGKSGKDTFTFAINLTTGAFNCKRGGCGATGNMITISKDFDFSLGTSVDEYYRPKKKYRSFSSPKEPIKPKDAAIKYLESRGISREIASIYEITIHKQYDSVLVFPFYDETGILRFIKYRKTNFDKNHDSKKEWCEKGCKPILFGMKQCETSSKTLIICEGQIDQLSLAESGYLNSVSVPLGKDGFTWIPFCWNWIQNFNTIIVFGDYENGEISLLNEVSRRFGQKVKHVREDDYKDCKDANEILLKYGKEQIKKCIENAVALPIKRVIKLSSVKNIDIHKIEKLATGISKLDYPLFGGLPFGGVHLLTAKAGSGKSTFASQIVVRAIYSKYKVFVYSGELPCEVFKNWLDLQVAGSKHIFAFQEPHTGREGYNVSELNRSLISNWYDDSLYMYDSNSIDGIDEADSLLDITEKVIQQYDVRVILLDNLMTAMIMDDTRGENENVRQTNFVNKLRIIALRYNVLIILVAHMRKNNLSQGNNDEIAGSSNIVNLAMTTISYERDKDIPENQRLIRLMKNRLFGELNTDGIIVSYDEQSRRIYGKNDDLDFDYGWDPDSDGFEELPPDDIPFD